jgi:MoaA/NifB/PqqE/SkfB family radical SAM enzyme
MSIISKNIAGQSVFYNNLLDVIYKTNCNIDKFDYFRTDREEIYDIVCEINKYCNQECINCYSESKKSKKKGTELSYSYISEKILENYDNIIRVSITGGEPLLHSEINKILNLPNKIPGLNYVISTNGSIIRKEIIKNIIDNDWLVCVSIHGMQNTHNTYTKSNNFKKAINFINILSGKVRIHLYCVLNNLQNINDLKFITSLRNEYNIDFVRYITPRHHGRWVETEDSTINMCKSILDNNAGIKRTKSLSKFYTVDMFERLSE